MTSFQNTWRCASFSDTGAVRQTNQDAMLCLTAQQLWAVADGMGGHHGGELASACVIEHLNRFTRTRHLGANLRQIDALLQLANRQLVAKAAQLSQQEQRSVVVGSTICTVAARHTMLLCVWVGDSRIYRYTEQSLQQISQDHTHRNLLDNLGDTQNGTEDLEGDLCRAIGAEIDLQVAYAIVPIQPRDYILLCSDGLTKELNDIELAEILQRRGSVESKIAALKAQCLARQARDNVTAIMLQFTP